METKFLGRLSYAAALAACVDGWRLPTVQEGKALAKEDRPELAEIRDVWTSDGYLPEIPLIRGHGKSAAQLRKDYERKRIVSLQTGWADSLQPDCEIPVVLVRA